MTPPRCVTVFRSRLRSDNETEYAETLGRMVTLAESMPGFRARKTFFAEDGERVTLVEFDTVEQARAWGAHPEHRAAQRRGHESFYSEFHVQTCAIVHESAFVRRANDD